MGMGLHTRKTFPSLGRGELIFGISVLRHTDTEPEKVFGPAKYSKTPSQEVSLDVSGILD